MKLVKRVFADHGTTVGWLFETLDDLEADQDFGYLAPEVRARPGIENAENQVVSRTQDWVVDTNQRFYVLKHYDPSGRADGYLVVLNADA